MSGAARVAAGGRSMPPRMLLLVAVGLGAVAAIYLGFGLLTASWTFGCDYGAYRLAAERYLAGEPIYDLTETTPTGSDCSLYQYPPPFLALILLTMPLPADLGAWAWIGLMVAAYVAAIWILPVRAEIRLAVFILGAIGWPFIFGVRIGQVGTLLLLIFGWGWRAAASGAARQLGAAIAVGTVVKLQPALLFLWLAVRRDWAALAAGLALLVGIVAVGVLAGLGDWVGFGRYLGQISDAVTVPTNHSIGATAFQLGLDAGLARAIQYVAIAGLVGLVVLAGWRFTAEAGYLVAVVVSQLASPVVWDHYAIVLLLPLAWLLARGHWWAVVIPVAQAWVFVTVMPREVYVLSFAVILVALVVLGWRERPGTVGPVGPVEARPASSVA